MKILFVSLFLPQKKAYHAGGKFVFEMIRSLSERHEIHLVTRLEENERFLIDELRPFCKEIRPYTYRAKEGKRNLLDLIALGLNYVGFSRFADRIARSGHFDLVQVEWVDAALMMKRRKTPIALTAHDVYSKPAERRMKAARGLRKLLNTSIFFVVRLLESRIMKKVSAVFTLSEYDRDYLLAMVPGIHVRVVPFPAGLDLTEKTFEQQKNSMLFLASYRFLRRNTDAALYFYREVFPRIRTVIPDATFVAAGYGPPEDLRKLQDHDPSVRVPGFVEDLDACYKKAAVFVAPILVGGGIIVKVLDAMAAGIPVVTTTYGNEGINAIPGRDLIVADDPVSFAAGVVRVLSDRQFAAQLGKKGKEFVLRHYSTGAAVREMEAAYQEIVSSE